MGAVSRVVGVTGKSVKHMAGVSVSQHIITFESGKSAIFETMLVGRRTVAALSQHPQNCQQLPVEHGAISSLPL